MIPINKVLLSSLIAATLLGGSSVSAAGLSADALFTSNGQIMADVSTLAGTGDFKDVNGAALSSAFRSPSGVLTLSDGSLLVADSRDHLVRKVSAGQVTTYAGPDLAVNLNAQGFPIGGLLNGKASEAFFNEPVGLAVDAQGNVYAADSSNHAVRKINASGQVTTLAGNGVVGNIDGSGGDARFNHPTDVAAAADGTVYVADTLNHVIRKITAAGIVTTLNAGSDRGIEVRPGEAAIAGDFKDGNLKDAKFNEPSGLTLDAKGNLYVSDTGNQRIRYIDLSAGVVSTVAGSGVTEKGALYAAGNFADGDALKASFDFPKGITVTSEGGLLIADSLNHSVRYLLNGKVSTIAGNTVTGETNGIESKATLYNPTDVAVAKDGSIIVADVYNNKIRKITPYKLPAALPKDNNIKVVYADQVISFEAQPEFTNERTMVPVRAISEALGYTVKYTELAGLKTIQLINGNITIELYIGKTGIKRVEKGKADIAMNTDVSPYVKSDLTYVPVRFFAEQVGLDVQWDQTTQTAIIR
ncbi:stalk domain-containing protein [Paenibacillus sp. GP183]|uniref:stalk domain-containing protein n=1 Tax=Paenibacillus sp. GP183 TaxID=1882751 RepID=UPI00089937CE|nr:stalk domain-containing protein [Paenibacillus sp. GP183]SEB76065.1 Glucose/arabinose dehydrogenase, beta-propeller fold [Paenibacillus sp. GP183]